MDEFDLLVNNYEKIFGGQYGRGHKCVIGPVSPIACRFCERSIPDVTFRTEAHAIPELLGNRQLVVTDECDACNAFFSRSVEDHLGKFTKPYRIVGQVRGKNGFPSYKSPKKLSRIDFRSGDGLVIQQRPSDDLVEIREDEGLVRIGFFIERHVPSAVYKALVKIALSVMPISDSMNFVHAKRWILHEDHAIPLLTPLKLLFYFVPGPRPHADVSIAVLRKKGSSEIERLPHYLLLLAFGNLQYQIMVPSLADNRAEGQAVDFMIPRFPSMFSADWPYGPPVPAIVDLSSGNPTEAKQFFLSLHYGSIEYLSGK